MAQPNIRYFWIKLLVPIYITKIIKKYLESVTELVIMWQVCMHEDVDDELIEFTSLYKSVIREVFGLKLSDCLW